MSGTALNIEFILDSSNANDSGVVKEVVYASGIPKRETA